LIHQKELLVLQITTSKMPTRYWTLQQKSDVSSWSRTRDWKRKTFWVIANTMSANAGF